MNELWLGKCWQPIQHSLTAIKRSLKVRSNQKCPRGSFSVFRGTRSDLVTAKASRVVFFFGNIKGEYKYLLSLTSLRTCTLLCFPSPRASECLYQRTLPVLFCNLVNGAQVGDFTLGSSSFNFLKEPIAERSRITSKYYIVFIYLILYVGKLLSEIEYNNLCIQDIMNPVQRYNRRRVNIKRLELAILSVKSEVRSLYGCTKVLSGRRLKKLCRLFTSIKTITSMIDEYEFWRNRTCFFYRKTFWLQEILCLHSLEFRYLKWRDILIFLFEILSMVQYCNRLHQ